MQISRTNTNMKDEKENLFQTCSFSCCYHWKYILMGKKKPTLIPGHISCIYWTVVSQILSLTKVKSYKSDFNIELTLMRSQLFHSRIMYLWSSLSSNRLIFKVWLCNPQKQKNIVIIIITMITPLGKTGAAVKTTTEMYAIAMSNMDHRW